MTSYRYIYNTRNDGDSVEEALKDKNRLPVIIKDERVKKYMIFDNTALALDYFSSQDKQYFHEVIFGHSKQRMKFDIEAIDAGNGIPDLTDFIYDLISVICEHTECAYNYVLSPTEIAILNGSRPGKVSYHIVIPKLVLESCEEAKDFLNEVIETMGEETFGVQYIDRAVYKRLQNFRLPNSGKDLDGKHYPLKLITTFGTGLFSLADLFITADYSCDGGAVQALQKISTTKAANLVKEVTSNVQNILDCLEQNDKLNAFSYRSTYGNRLLFDRKMPSHCAICNEVHHNDNTFNVTVEKQRTSDTGTIYNIVEHCRHYRSKEIVICEMNINGEFDSQSRLANFINETCDNRGIFDKEQQNKDIIYSEPKMRDYELLPSLVVKAEMGKGKTKALKSYLSDYFTDTVIKKRKIVFITFRQTFSKSVSKIFTDFNLYSDLPSGSIPLHKYSRIIVQVESLHRINFGKAPADPVDLIIMDESEAIISQFNSGLHKNFNGSFATFKWLLDTAKHVICMDANAGERTVNTLKLFRQHQINFHHNEHKSAEDHHYFMTSNKETWISNLFDHLLADKKVVLPFNSLTDAKTIFEMVKDTFPSKKIQLYSSEMQQSIKNEHFSNVHKHWADLDVLIYTPTCSAGISFELDYYDVLFAFFVNSSCDVESSRQMLARVRNIRAKEFYVYLMQGSIAVPITRENIKKELYARRSYAFDNDTLPYEFDKNGMIKFAETSYFHIWIENKLVENLSRKNFARRFITQIKNSGAICDLMSAGHVNILYDNDIEKWTINTYKNTRSDIKHRKNVAIADSTDITYVRATEIIESIKTQKDITDDDMFALEKFRLRSSYNLGDRHPITTVMVETLNTPNQKRTFSNRQLIHNYKSISIALLEIKTIDVQNSLCTLEQKKSSTEYWDLQIAKHDYWVHASTLSMMGLCGLQFGCPGLIYCPYFDSLAISNNHLLLRHIKIMASACNISDKKIRQLTPESIKYIGALLNILNDIMNHVYGYSVASVDGEYYSFKDAAIGNEYIKSKQQNLGPKDPLIVFAEWIYFMRSKNQNYVLTDDEKFEMLIK